MSRADHQLDARGDCRRCGLSRRFGKICPPGFWMTKYESAQWHTLAEHERPAFERWCLGGGPIIDAEDAEELSREPLSMQDVHDAYRWGAAAAFGLLAMAEAIRRNYICWDCDCHIGPNGRCFCGFFDDHACKPPRATPDQSKGERDG